MRQSTTLLQFQALQTCMFLSVLTQPLTIEMSLNETGGAMTMALPFRQKAMVKIVLFVSSDFRPGTPELSEPNPSPDLGSGQWQVASGQRDQEANDQY